MEYTLVSTMTKKGLISDVNKLIKDGWVPQGGVAEHGTYYQAMIKLKKDS